jgi:valyl-tRNA synthetase
MNKIWNATRFALTSLEGFEVPEDGCNATPNRSELSVFDQWITYRLAQTESEMEKSLGADRFSDAANAIYAFVWHDFCDWYIEFSKPVLVSGTESEKRATQLVLAQTLNRVMRLLHPFAPFITEELYQKLPIRSEALVIADYPTPENDKKWLSVASEAAAAEVEVVKEVVTAIRNIRGENRIKPGVQIKVRLAVTSDEAQKILSSNKTAIMKLARLEECEIGEPGSLSKCAVSPVRMGDIQIDVIVALEGVVDLEEEIKRLHKTIERVQKDIALLAKKLGNENFVKNAPADIIEKDKALLQEHREKVVSLQESLNRLQ